MLSLCRILIALAILLLASCSSTPEPSPSTMHRGTYRPATARPSPVRPGVGAPMVGQPGQRGRYPRSSHRRYLPPEPDGAPAVWAGDAPASEGAPAPVLGWHPPSELEGMPERSVVPWTCSRWAGDEIAEHAGSLDGATRAERECFAAQMWLTCISRFIWAMQSMERQTGKPTPGWDWNKLDRAMRSLHKAMCPKEPFVPLP